MATKVPSPEPYLMSYLLSTVKGRRKHRTTVSKFKLFFRKMLLFRDGRRSMVVVVYD